MSSQSQPSRIDPAGLYRLSSFIDMTGVSRATWYVYMDDGKAPLPVFKHARRVSVWRGSDILSWLDNPTTWAERNRLAA